jgi:hypothetical protein
VIGLCYGEVIERDDYMEKWVSTKDVLDKTKIPRNTILRYLSEEYHGHHFNIKIGDRKSKLIPASQVELIVQIKKWYDGGKTKEEVNQLLEDRGVPMVITVPGDSGELVIKDVAEELSEIKKLFQVELEFKKALMEEIQDLKEGMVRQQEYIDNKLIERNEEVVKSLRESMKLRKAEFLEAESMAAASQENKKKWWVFWK